MKQNFLKLFIFFSFFKLILAKNSEDLIREGIRLSNEGKRQEAILLFQEAIRIDEKRSGLAWHNLGYTYELMGKKEEARLAYQKAIERDPTLLQSRINLGKLEFSLGLYREAVANGEAVLAVDPGNFEVNQYLPLAKSKLSEQETSLLLAQREKAPETTKLIKQGTDILYETGFSLLTPFSYQKENDAIALYRQSGFTGIPYSLYAAVDIPNRFGIYLDIRNPYFGILNPQFMAGQQRFEYYHYFKKFFLGAGIVLTQLSLNKDQGFGQEAFIENREYSRVSDNKLGVLFGFKDLERMLVLRIFTRYLFRDPVDNPKLNEVDFVLLELNLRHRLFLFSSDSSAIAKAGQDLFFSARLEEFYIMEYKYNNQLQNRSHWFATYLFEIGLEFNMAQANHKWGFSFAERIYFRNLNNNNPWAFGNGQGYFGFHSELALQGNAFPSFRSNSHLFQIFFRQIVFGHIMLKEKLGLEITTPAESVHSFFLEFGMSYYLNGS